MVWQPTSSTQRSVRGCISLYSSTLDSGWIGWRTNRTCQIAEPLSRMFTSGAGCRALTLSAEAKGSLSSLISRPSTSLCSLKMSIRQMKRPSPYIWGDMQGIIYLLLSLLSNLQVILTLESLVLIKMIIKMMSRLILMSLHLTDHLVDHACLVSASGPSRLYTDTVLT